MRSHDLTGRLFQQLIADRKFLAAFYTTPAAASLLVGLAISTNQPLEDAEWGNAERVTRLRIADFACGTGTLLSTAYQRVGQLHELAGGNAEDIHSRMMAASLIGCDVMPSAAHLTASMLAGAHPTIRYERSRIMTVAYGKQHDGALGMGSLDLLDSQRRFKVLDITAKIAEGVGEADASISASVPHASCDIVLMNPPFTRATGHEATKIGVPVPMFAAFNTSDDEQRQMSDVIKRMTLGSAAHGNAGLASIFLVLGDRKLRNGGTIGLVMPVSLMSGDAWEGARKMLSRYYSNLIVVSIAGGDGRELSFSADTDIGECLVIGLKSGNPSSRATFVVLNDRPVSQMVGVATATQIVRAIQNADMRQLEDGPIGGTPLRCGDEIVGHAMQAPISGGTPWNLARIADLSLAQSAFQLAVNGRVWLPTMHSTDAVVVPVTTIAHLGKIGPYHMDINAAGTKGAIRGPFTIQPLHANSAPTYPVLWSHAAAQQRTMMFGADSEGIQRKSRSQKDRSLIDDKVKSIWESSSHCHFNRDFRFNSQSTSMQFTADRTIGGRAWPSIRLASTQLEKVLVLWSNTSLGLLLHWWHANKQQAGRGSIGVLPLQHLPVLDVAKISPKRLDVAESLFDRLSSRPLGRFSEINADPVRSELDEDFGRSVLGIPAAVFKSGGPMTLLRQKLALEPSIRG